MVLEIISIIDKQISTRFSFCHSVKFYIIQFFLRQVEEVEEHDPLDDVPLLTPKEDYEEKAQCNIGKFQFSEYFTVARKYLTL